jgi:outer membrane protein assembly factor BamB
MSARTGLLIGVALLVGPGLGAAAHGLGRPAIQVTPHVAPPTARVQVIGRGFGSNESVDLLLDSVQVAEAQTDGAGSLRQALRLPRQVLPGDHRVAAIGAESGLQADAGLVVQTDWPMFRFEPANTGFNPYENILGIDSVGGLEEAWSAQTAGDIITSPAFADGLVYVGTSGPGPSQASIYAFDASTGNEVWIAETQGLGADNPTVAHGVVYVGTLIDHALHAFDASSGQELWTFQAVGAMGSPVVSRGVVYAAANTGIVYAVRARTGDPLWIARIGGPISGSLALHGGVVYIGTGEGAVFALDAATGDVIWIHETPRPIAVSSTPAVLGGVVYIGSNDGFLYALDALTGRLRWKYQTEGGVASSPAVAYGTVYVGSTDHFVHAIDATSGALVWRFQTGDFISYASPAIANGVVFIGSTDQIIYALDARRGAILWSQTLGGGINDAPAVANGTVYIAGLEPVLHAFTVPATAGR